MESDLLGLHLSVLDVNLVANENDGDVLANSDEILVPLGNVLVSDSRADVEHDDSAIASNATMMLNLMLLTSNHLSVLLASLDRRYPKH